jgi:hypothetical protein
MNIDSKLKYIKEQIQSKNIDHTYIKNFLDTYNINYSLNKNGIYFNLSKINKEYIDILYKLIENINIDTIKNKQDIEKINKFNNEIITNNNNTHDIQKNTFKIFNKKLTNEEEILLKSSLII